LEEEKDALAQQEAKAKKGNMKPEEEKNFDETINKLQFKIEILDQRASRFEVNALKKYEELDSELSKDYRLRALK